MLGSFGGIYILNFYRPHEEEKKEATNYIYGMISIFAFVITAALVVVLNRRMKSVHFSIIQWNYALVAWTTMLAYVLGEYYYNRDPNEKYPFESLRMLH